jgi:hypothetical protein
MEMIKAEILRGGGKEASSLLMANVKREENLDTMQCKFRDERADK